MSAGQAARMEVNHPCGDERPETEHWPHERVVGGSTCDPDTDRESRYKEGNRNNRNQSGHAKILPSRVCRRPQSCWMPIIMTTLVDYPL